MHSSVRSGRKLEVAAFQTLEVELVISDTVHAAMCGKNYSRAMVYHKTIFHALELLLFVALLETKQEKDVDPIPKEAKNKLTSPSKPFIVHM